MKNVYYIKFHQVIVGHPYEPLAQLYSTDDISTQFEPSIKILEVLNHLYTRRLAGTAIESG